MSTEQDKAYYELCGYVIKQAISDYKHLRFESNKNSGVQKAERKRIWKDAKNFLFTERLQQYLVCFGIQNIVSVEAIRREANQT